MHIESANRDAAVSSKGVLGIDIGGANLKYATESGRSLERSFPMWTRFNELGEQIARDVASLGDCDTIAVTMTGELADCFLNRSAGVKYIVDQVMTGLPHVAPERIRFYGTDGRFHDAASAKTAWQRIAASNWHALAQCVANRVAPDALLIDIGSTTTDIIAIAGSRIVTESTTDFQRLRDQSLVYIGCRRTPVCVLVTHLRFRGENILVMNEVFATIDDARLMLGLQDEDVHDCETADSHPRDRHHARSRIARMIGLDHDQISEQEAIDFSNQIHAAASRRINAAVQKWWHRLQEHRTIDQQHGPFNPAPSPAVCILSGHGQDLATAPPDAPKIDLRSELSRDLSRAAPAWAVAVLAGTNNKQ